MRKIVLTGGGTAGHVTPNIALLPELQKKNFSVSYIGSIAGIEKELIGNLNIPYYGISSGKLRRYFDLKNVTDIVRVVKGVAEASSVLKKIKPDIIFSKGGFVTVPVIVAAHFLKIPIIIHESDITPGLANRISIPFATHVCASFPETIQHLPAEKAILTGSPIRASLFEGKENIGRTLCGFSSSKPIILIMGGSLGSVRINDCVRTSLPNLLKKFNIIHICGKNNLDTKINLDGYLQFEYVAKELPHLFACCSLIVSRAGSNSIYEFLALRKPNLLIPLTKEASRGDQILNAKSFSEHGFSAMLYEEAMTGESLCENIFKLYDERKTYIQKMETSGLSNGVSEIMKLIDKDYKTT